MATIEKGKLGRYPPKEMESVLVSNENGQQLRWSTKEIGSKMAAIGNWKVRRQLLWIWEYYAQYYIDCVISKCCNFIMLPLTILLLLYYCKFSFNDWIIKLGCTQLPTYVYWSGLQFNYELNKLGRQSSCLIVKPSSTTDCGPSLYTFIGENSDKLLCHVLRWYW